MRYAPISETEFNTRYQLLTNYLKANEDKTLPEIIYRLNNLPNGHALKNKNFFVLNRSNHKSFLHKAAAEGNLLLIRFLNATDHEINLTDGQHKTALYDACAQLKLDAVNHLLGYDANPNRGSGHITTRVFYEGVEIEVTGEINPLVASIESKATVTAAELTAIFAATTKEDFSHLTTKQATEQAAAKIVAKLIAKRPNGAEGADVNLQSGLENFSAMHRAIINLQPLIVKVFADFIETNFRLVDRDQQAALHMVVEYRNEAEKQKDSIQMQKEKQITELIIPHLEAINIKDKNGNTPLTSAVINSNADVVAAIYKKDYLFSHEKLLSIKNNAGNTAIHEAILEAKRGPKVLAILLRVATPDDLAVTNNQGETAQQLATRLINEAETVRNLVDEMIASADELENLLGGSDEVEQHVSASLEIEQLQDAILRLDNHLDHHRATHFLSVDLEGLSLDAEHHRQAHSVPLADVQDLINRAKKIATDAQKEFFPDDHIKSLNSVHQLEYAVWKNNLFDNASPFPNLDNVDTQSTTYQADRAQANIFLGLGEGFFNVNDNSNAKNSFKSAIRNYARLKDYEQLEQCYQHLAKIYIGSGDGTVTRYETENQAKLHSLNNLEKLQGHLALGGLYKELRAQSYVSRSFSSDDLQAHESYHYYHAYKLTQGNLDGDANVVLQHEMGIANNAKLGTYNIQQCVAVIAFDPSSKKVVLSHFDRYSGPLSFMEQIVNEFSNSQSKIELYLSGGRDRISTVSTTSATKISDNNIDQVLKQIYAEQERFVIKAAYLGDNPSPAAIVFDAQSQQLVHATPDLSDSSLSSREVKFFLQALKKVGDADYLSPLDRVDFRESVADRTIPFSEPAYAAQQLEIHTKVVFFTPRFDQTMAWNHQELYPFINIQNELIRKSQNFQQGLLKKALLDRYVGKPGFTNLPCIATRRRRDVGLCELDSVRLFDDLSELPETKQSEVLEQLATRRVGGAKQKAVATLMRNQKTTRHLQKAGEISSRLTDGMFTEEAIVDLFKNGDATPAIQIAGLKGSGHALGKVAEFLNEKGLRAENPLERKLWRGSASFARRGTALLNIFNLVKDVKALNTNDTNAHQDAKVRVASDIVYTSVDGVEIAVEVAEATSETMAEMAISSVAGPVGEVAVAIVTLANRIYDDVEIVEREGQSVHLTAWEKFKEGCLAFLALGPEDYIKKMMDEVTEYNRILPQKLEFLQNHPELKHIIFPAIEKRGENCRMVTLEKPSCSAGGPLFPSTCTNQKKVCDPIFSEVRDNSVYFKDKLIGFELTREVLTAPVGSEFLCLPTDDGKSGDGKSPTEEGAYACDRALGLTNVNSTANAVYYNLGDGEDHAGGFEDVPNVFMVNNGAKDYEGGMQDDIYIVQATQIMTALPTDREGNGGFDGKGGSDSLILSGFQPTNRTEVNLNTGYFRAGNNTLLLTSIEKIVGGAFPFSVTAGCATEEIDMAGGSTLSNFDTILIPRNATCDYDLKMHLRPNINVTNAAERGHFIYYILSDKGSVSVNLTVIEGNATIKPLEHQFVFNTLISDVSSLSFSDTLDHEQPQAIKLHFLDHRMRKFLRTLQSISFTQSTSSANASIAYQLKPGSSLDKTPFVLPTQLSAAQGREVFKKYSIDPADSFNVTLNQRHEIRHALLNLIDDESVEDFTFQLNAHSSNSTSLHFVDNAELKIGKKNLYFFQQNLNLTVSEIMDRYAYIAMRLNLICILTTKNHEQIVIGHNGREVMNNNPLAKTHLNGNGGEGLFVIKSGMESLLQSGSRLPLSEVAIYRRPEDTNIDSLDFRALNAQVRAINATAKLRFITPNKRNKLGNDLKLVFGMQTPWTPSNKVIPIVEILLKDVQNQHNHWHKKYLHIYLNDNKPHRIVGRHSHLHLKPIPLVLGPQHEMAIIGINDVAEETDIIIPYACQPGAFFHHNQTNLLWTNTLSDSANAVEPFTLIIDKFFLAPTLRTLSLQFTNKRIALAKINAVEDFEKASKAHLARLRATSLAILSPQPVLPISNQEANISEIEARQDQEHYLGNDINATSIEDQTHHNSVGEENDIDHFRQRRSAEHLEEHSVTNAAPRHMGIFPTTVRASSIFNKPIKQNVAQVANDFSQFKAEPTSLSINYDGTSYENTYLIKWIASLFAPSAAKRMHEKGQILSQSEKTSDLDWAFKNLQDGINKYGRG